MIDIRLLPKQARVFRPVPGVQYDVTLYQGGFGAGKTKLGAIKGLSVLAENWKKTRRKANWLVAADTMARLDQSTWLTYEELLDDAKVIYKPNQSKHIIRIPGWGGSKVIFKGLDDPLALRSANGIGGHLEEASLLSEQAYLEFMGRLRQAGNDDIISLMLTTNPPQGKGWMHEHFVKRAGITTEIIKRPDINGVMQERETRISRRKVIVSTLENPYVPDAFIAMMKASYDEELYRIVVMGLDGDYTKGLVSHSFSELNIIDTNYRPHEDLYLFCDFNVDPMCWVVGHLLNRLDAARREYHIFDEIVIPNTNIPEAIDEFVRRYPDHGGNLIIGGDASGNNRNVQNDKVGGTSYTQMKNRLREHNYHLHANIRVDVREANPAISDRVAAWNAKVCNADGVRSVFIHPRCERLLMNLQTLKYKEGTGAIDLPTESKMKADPSLKFMGHPFDAASYFIEKYDPIIIKSYTNAPPSTTVNNALSALLRRK